MLTTGNDDRDRVVRVLNPVVRNKPFYEVFVALYKFVF